MKTKFQSFALILACSAYFGILNSAKASVTINYEVAEIKSGGVNISVGTLFFVSYGANNVLDSINWTSGSSFILGDDRFFAAVPIVNGVAAGALASVDLPNGTIQNATKFGSIFVKDMTSSIVDFSTGILRNGATFGTTGGTSYAFGSYRTDSIETFGGDPTGNMAWIFPSDGATLQLSAYSGTGDYVGQDITASLITSSSLIVIPEPSIASLSILGMGFALGIRRKLSRK
jgi:hypothetical protein